MKVENYLLMMMIVISWTATNTYTCKENYHDDYTDREIVNFHGTCYEDKQLKKTFNDQVKARDFLNNVDYCTINWPLFGLDLRKLRDREGPLCVSPSILSNLKVLVNGEVRYQ